MNRFIRLTLLLLPLFFIGTVAHAAVTPDATTNFITTWNTENDGTSASNQITIPGRYAGYSYEIYWEDTASSTINGTTTLITTSSHTITFPAPGIYEVQASGTFPRISLIDGGDEEKLLTVEQWGNIAWTSMKSSFTGATNLTIPAVDEPDLSGVTSMANAFARATSFNQDISGWDVSNVTDMNGMFYGATSFNQDISGWDVSAVTDISSSFFGATSFNQPLNNWITASVTDMDRVFNGATSFNQPLNSWITASVTDMTELFYNATSFNQDISGWDVSNVTDMVYIFNGATSFDQPLDNWDVSAVTDMTRLFYEATSFNQPLNSWRASSTAVMDSMFYGATSFNQPLNNWITASVTDMDRVFYGATSFNQDVSGWDVSNVTDFSAMFFEATSFNQPLNTWDTSSAINMASMFYGATSFNQDISIWDVSNVTNLGSIFSGATSFSQDLGSWGDHGVYILSYSVDPGASLIGSSYQVVISGEDGTSVTITPDEGYQFVQWSDGSTANPRTDTSVTSNLTVTAEIEEIGGSSGSGSGGGRIKTTSVTSVESISTNEPLPVDESLDVFVKKISAISVISLDTEKDRDVIIELIASLLKLVELLTQMLTKMEG